MLHPKVENVPQRAICMCAENSMKPLPVGVKAVPAGVVSGMVVAADVVRVPTVARVVVLAGLLLAIPGLLLVVAIGGAVLPTMQTQLIQPPRSTYRSTSRPGQEALHSALVTFGH